MLVALLANLSFSVDEVTVGSSLAISDDVEAIEKVEDEYTSVVCIAVELRKAVVEPGSSVVDDAGLVMPHSPKKVEMFLQTKKSLHAPLIIYLVVQSLLGVSSLKSRIHIFQLENNKYNLKS